MNQDNTPRLGLNSIYRIVRRYIWVGILLLVATCAGSLIHHLAFPKYQATSTIHIKSDSMNPLIARSSRAGQIAPLDFSMSALYEKYLKTINSGEFDIYVGNHLGDQKFEKWRNWLKKNYNLSDDELKVSLKSSTTFKGRDEDLIDINSEAEDPKRAMISADLMSRIVMAFIEDDESREISEAQKYLTLEIGKSKTRMDALFNNLDARQDSEVEGLSTDDSQSTTTRIIADLKTEIERVRIQLKEVQALRNSLLSLIQRQNPGLNAQEIEEKIELDGIRGQIADRMRNLREEERGLNARGEAIKERLVGLNTKMKSNPERKIYDFKKQLDLEQSLSLDLKKQIFDLEIYKISVSNKVRTYSTAETLKSVVRIPYSRKLLVAIIFSAALLIIIIVVTESISPSFVDGNQFQYYGIKYLSGIPKLKAGVGLIDRLVKKPRLVFTSRSLSRFNLKSREIDSFKFLRYKILQFFNEAQVADKIISITSPASGEGKSLITANLALCFAFHNEKVLLIDTDTVRKSQLVHFPSEKMKGLYDIFKSNISIDDAVQHSSFRNLDIIHAGADFELLDHVNDLKNLLAQCRERYDLIILDTPAFLSGEEAVQVSKLAGTTLLVADVSKTKVSHISFVVESLNASQVQNCAGIANNIEDYFEGIPKNYYYLKASQQKKVS